MKFIRKNLIEGETIITEARITRVLILPQIILAVSFTAISLCFRNAGLTVIALMIGVALVLSKWISICHVELAITNRRIIGKTGLIRLTHLDCPLDKVDTVQVHNNYLGALFDYGNVTITTSSKKFSFNDIAHASQFKASVLTETERYKNEKFEMRARASALPEYSAA